MSRMNSKVETFRKTSMMMDVKKEQVTYIIFRITNNHLMYKSLLLLTINSEFVSAGTLLTASAHIITAVIGSGVLSLAWAIAQLGWVAGPAVLLAFSFITYFTSTLLADSYRSPGPISGKRNYTYMDVVRSHLGTFQCI